MYILPINQNIKKKKKIDINLLSPVAIEIYTIIIKQNFLRYYFTAHRMENLYRY